MPSLGRDRAQPVHDDGVRAASCSSSRTRSLVRASCRSSRTRRAFGMQTLFRQVGIYSAVGQLYEPEDHDELLYREAKTVRSWRRDHRGGALFVARRGDLVFGARQADASVLHLLLHLRLPARRRSHLGRGRLACAWFSGRRRRGRTTLAGEGLQHQDGSSHLIAATFPNCRAYDPCFGLRARRDRRGRGARMLEAQEDVFYYLTVANENYPHPAMPKDAREGILRGMYRIREGAQVAPRFRSDPARSARGGRAPARTGTSPRASGA